MNFGEKILEQAGFILLATFLAFLLGWLPHQLKSCSVSEARFQLKYIYRALLQLSDATHLPLALIALRSDVFLR